MNKKWIVTHHYHNFDWIYNYTNNYLIYDKTNTLQETDNIKHQKNVGYNIYDMFHFIVNNYDNLPDVCVFIKANIFERQHCFEEKFKRLINNNTFTPLESYEHLPISHVHIKGEDGGYCELNTLHGCWTKSQNEFFKTYNEFLDIIFTYPEYPKWIRFAPGANYIIPKENILFYSKSFYERLMNYVGYSQINEESHIIERSLITIFSNKFKEKI